MSQVLIGFGNKSRNGKDTACLGIVEWCMRHDFPVLHVNFADALKVEVTEAIRAAGSIGDLLVQGAAPGIIIPSWVQPTPNAELEPLSPYGKHVKLLQWWGGDYRRSENENYWLDKWKPKVVDFDGVVVASDSRYFSEAVGITELGGYNANVRRLNEDGSQYLDPSRSSAHRSETELDSWNWDFRIIGGYGQQDLVKMQAVQVLKFAMKEKGWTK